MKRSLNSRHSWNLHSLHSLTACHPCDICCTVRSKCVVNEVTVNVWHARVVSLTYLGDLVESSPMVLCHPWMQALTREKALTLKLILVPGCPSAPISASAFFKTVEGHTTKHQSKGPLKISSPQKPGIMPTSNAWQIGWGRAATNRSVPAIAMSAHVNTRFRWCCSFAMLCLSVFCSGIRQLTALIHVITCYIMLSHVITVFFDCLSCE